MAYVNQREGSTRYNAPAGADFTNSGANTEATLQIVKLDSSGNVVASSAATDKHIGIIVNNPTDGDTADVVLINAQGTAKVQVGGAVNIGDYLTADSSGHAVATTTSGDILIGMALTAATSSPSHQTVEVLLFRGKY